MCPPEEPVLNKSASNSPLLEQVAVITGAGRGIGRDIALTLAELGAHTVLCGRSRGALQQTSIMIENNSGGGFEKEFGEGAAKR
jgi:NAD(P)-dependent dehydrogenase (short-subunit alcohol dehydrogenase family)